MWTDVGVNGGGGAGGGGGCCKEARCLRVITE